MIRMRVSVDMGGVDKMLTRMEANASNFVVTFEYARQLLSKANAENFTTGGLPVGGWKPRKEAEGWPLMRETGQLMESLVDLRGSPNEIRPNTATFGTDVDYAPFHQAGTTKMASRKIVYEPRGFARDVADAAVDHILGIERYFPR